MSEFPAPAAADILGGVDTEACYRYVVEHQTREGGFCFYAYRPWGVGEPNAPDTHAAVDILTILERPVPAREHCIAWLRMLQDHDGGFSTLVIAYAALEALRTLGAAPAKDPREYLRETARSLGLTDGEREPTRWVAGAYCCIELWEKWGLEPDAAMRARVRTLVGRLRRAEGGFGDSGASLPETAAAVALGAAQEGDVAREVLAYVRRCEGPPYGINVAPSALSSDLESQWAGAWLLARLGAQLRYAALVREFVALCQNPDGGFGRSPGSVPRLSDTLLALRTLGLLARMPEPD
jgi:hypothetical protein